MFHRTRCQAWGVVFIAAQRLMSTVPALGQIQTTRTSVHNDVSPAVRDLPTIDPTGITGQREAEPVPRLPLPPRLQSTICSGFWGTKRFAKSQKQTFI